MRQRNSGFRALPSNISSGGTRGQVLVEYVLTLMIALSVLSVIIVGFRTNLMRAWRSIAMDIVKACPKCPETR
jgi:hypothetical protein